MAKYSLIRIITGAILILFAGSCATEKDYLITIDTNYGKMYAILYDETPAHKENFKAVSQRQDKVTTLTQK